MDWQYLMTSFDGRINRQPYWIGVVIIIVAAIILGLLIGAIFGLNRIALLALNLVLFYFAAAIMVKRLHDRDRPSWFAAIMIGPSLLKSLTDALGMTGNALNANTLDYLLGALILGMGIWALVELGFLKGTDGPNKYGPDPLAG